MIKRITFVTGHGDAAAGTLDAPPDIRPSRVAVSTTLPDLTGPEPRHDGIVIEWFADADHLRRFEAWLGAPDRAAGPVLVTEESVMRGAEWLDQRWRDGGEKLKHMAVAVRAEGLAPAEFSERWRAHSGRNIPDRVRGLAYVQNHPCPRTTGEWAYDAVNEVYFDDITGLRARVDWFRENLTGPLRSDLFRASWFLAVREEILSG